jgi:PIN domain nuclease of toxin-antitoxin system
MIYTVDAHAFIWFVIDSPRLSSAADAALSDATSQLILPATAYAEACWIVQHGRIPGYGVCGYTSGSHR